MYRPSNLQSSFTEGDASTSTRLHDKTSEDIQFGAEDEQLSADDLGISVLNTSNTDHQSSELVVGVYMFCYQSFVLNN